jgi:hypothetical protein
MLTQQMIYQRWKAYQICLAILIQCAMLLGIYRLLLQAKLGGPTEVIFLSEAILVLIVAPYLSSRTLVQQFGSIASDELLALSPLRFRSLLWRSIVGSQLPTGCFLILSTFVLTIFMPLIGVVPRLNVLLLHLVFGIYSVSGAAVGALGWRIFRIELFATELAYFVWLLLIGGVFLLAPIDRYLENLQPIIPPFLHINPLVAVCYLLEMDIFRTPNLYELTPIPSYLFAYPPWYIICGWQAVLGMSCFLLASSRRFHSRHVFA